MRNTLRAACYHALFAGQGLAGCRGSAIRNAERTFAGKSLIFCITNGRSGTRTLASLFGCLPNVDAFHEAKPSFHLLMRWVQGNPALARDFWLYAKLPAIAVSPKPVYLDSSHLVAKGYLEPLLELGGRPKLIVLKRDARLIARSMLALGDIPGRSKRALKWYLSPADPVFGGLRAAERLTDYQLCYWHALETEERQRHYRHLAQALGLTVAEADTRTLNELPAFEALCTEVGLAVTEEARTKLSERIGRTLNARTREKTTPSIGTIEDLDAAEAEVRRLMTTVVPVR